MRKLYLSLIPISIIFIYILFHPFDSVRAFPYVPPPPPPPAVDVPLPIPPPVDNPPKQDEPAGPPPPPPPPTPTPCIPNWCFVMQTECCFDPICIFLGQTNSDNGVAKNRCDTSPETMKKFTQSPSKSVSFLSEITLFFQSLFSGKK